MTMLNKKAFRTAFNLIAVACGLPPATSPGESCGFQPGAAGTLPGKVSGAFMKPA